jgi:D-3-phosphoglycerate dehydrogenase
VTGDRVVIGFSERLLPVTAEERRIEAEPNAELRVVPLWSEDEIRRNAADVDILVVGAAEPLTGGVLADLPRCRLIVRRGVGVDNVDVAAATELGIVVAYTPDASIEEVSDHALALLLALERRVVALDRAIHGGAWQRGSTALADIRSPTRRLGSLTLGVVGLGKIGRTLARKAAPLVGRVVGTDPYVAEADARAAGIEPLPFEQLLAVADLISIHAPATPETEGMFDAEAFARMRPTTMVVNTARGGLIDEAALIEALFQGRIAGAALDVTDAEPLPDEHPLLAAPNVILTGHSAASSTAASGELRRRSVDAALAVFRGEVPAALVDPGVLHRPNCRIHLPDRG